MRPNKTQETNVIQYIKSNYTLPESGVVAGQAVASLIYRELGLDIEFFINDVDVFTKKSGQYQSNLLPRTYKTEITDQGNSMVELIDFKNNNIASYKVVRSKISEEDENVNIIYVNERDDYSKQLPDEIECFNIISTFDFNCCAVGFDIVKEEMVYTDSFLTFLKYHKLRVLSSQTPYHTLLRLNKKMQEFGSNSVVTCNLNIERKVLLSSPHIYSYFHAGEKICRQYEKYADDFIKELFNVDKVYETEYGEVTNDKGEKVTLHLFDINKDFIEEHICKKTEYNCNNASDSVHFFHLFNNTGIFSEEYKQTVLKMKTENPQIFRIYIKSINFSPLEEIDLNVDIEIYFSEMFKKHPKIINILNYKNYSFCDSVTLLNLLKEHLFSKHDDMLFLLQMISEQLIQTSLESSNGTNELVLRIGDVDIPFKDCSRFDTIHAVVKNSNKHLYQKKYSKKDFFFGSIERIDTIAKIIHHSQYGINLFDCYQGMERNSSEIYAISYFGNKKYFLVSKEKDIYEIVKGDLSNNLKRLQNYHGLNISFQDGFKELLLINFIAMSKEQESFFIKDYFNKFIGRKHGLQFNHRKNKLGGFRHNRSIDDDNDEIPF